MTATVTGFQVMPPLSPEEYQALETSIREHGVQVPITVAPDGRMVDGHHRAEIAAKFDLHCPRVTAKGDDTQLRTLAFELNNHRRQQTREARRAQVRRSLRADPQLSNRQHAARTGVHHETVASVRSDMESTGEIRQSDTRTSGDGRVRPATQPERTSAPATPEAFEAEYGMRPDEADALISSEMVTDRDEFDQAAIDLSAVDMETGEIHEPADEVSTAEPTPAPKPVTTGIDGKEYRRPAPKAEPDRPRRAPLTDAFFKAAYDLRKNVERLERLVEDDRFTQNREQVALRHENDLNRTAEALTGVLRAINNR